MGLETEVNQLRMLVASLVSELESLRDDVWRELGANAAGDEGTEFPASWRFTQVDATTGTVDPGLMLIRWEVKVASAATITDWPTDNLITVGPTATHFWLLFTIAGSTITCEWKSGTAFPDGSQASPATHVVPILQFTLTEDNTIDSWTQHQCGNVLLQRL